MSSPITPCGPESVVMKPIFSFCCANAGAAATSAAMSPTNGARNGLRTDVPPRLLGQRRAFSGHGRRPVYQKKEGGSEDREGRRGKGEEGREKEGRRRG